MTPKQVYARFPHLVTPTHTNILRMLPMNSFPLTKSNIILLHMLPLITRGQILSLPDMYRPDEIHKLGVPLLKV
jgi:hypothetical protein